MTTKLQLASVLEQCLQHGTRAAIAVVVETDGSVYRRAGARSVVTEQGAIHGIISGGCAEQDLLERAKVAWEMGTVERMQYDFRSPEDLLWGMGAGCNGSLTVAIVPVNPLQDRDAALRLVQDMRRRADTSEPYTVASVFRSGDPDVIGLGPLPDSAVTRLLESGLVTFDSDEAPRLQTMVWDGIDIEVFFEHVPVRPRLVVFGAGDDAQPVVRLASELDWSTTVVDHRSLFNHSSRFPWADRVALVRRDAYASIPMDPQTSVVIMTHNYELDRMILQAVLPQNIAYLGILGPRRRFERLLDEVVEAGVQIQAADLHKVHSPIGLDIGAETAEDIAVSIVAELMAWRKSRPGQSLHLRVGAISPGGGP